MSPGAAGPARAAVRAVLACGALLAVLGASACTASGPAPAEAPSEPPDGLLVEVSQHRDDVAPRRLEITFENTGELAVDIGAVRLDSPRFDGTAVDDDGPALAPGRRVDVRVELPPPRCDDAAEGEDAVEFAFVAGERSGTARVRPADPRDTIARVHDDDCFAEAVRRTVVFELPDALEPGADGSGATGGPGVPAALRIGIRPTGADAGGEPITLVRWFATTLLAPLDGEQEALDVVIEPGGPPAELELALRPSRCQKHAVAEDKAGTVLPVEVRLADGRLARIPLAAGERLRAALYAFVGEYCGPGIDADG